MLIFSDKFNSPFVHALIISIITVSTLFVWEGAKDYYIGDEGFYLYGIQRVLHGEVPMLDFQSYDPGRYYWAAAIMRLVNDEGVMAARAAAAVFQAIGLFVGLFLITKSLRNKNIIYVLVSAVVLAAWMQPYYKAYDHAASIFLIGAITILVNKPTNAYCFLAGLCIGLIAFLGRNHGVYGLLGCIGALLWLSIQNRGEFGFVKSLLIMSLGILVGYAPMILLILSVSGFEDNFVNGIIYLIRTKGYSFPQVVPWPWLVEFNSGWLYEDVKNFLIGVFFILILLFGVLSLCWVAWRALKNESVSPVLVASAFLALPYAHYSYSRADLNHLSLGIFPLLIGCLVLSASRSSKFKWSIASLLCISSLWVMRESHPGWMCHTSQCIEYEVSGDKLLIKPYAANLLSLLQKLADKYAPNGRSFIATPFWPGAYAFLDRKSPMRDNYIIFPRPEEFQKAEIERIKEANPGFVIINNSAWDGREELRFSNNRSLIYDFINESFEKVYDFSDYPYEIYKEKS